MLIGCVLIMPEPLHCLPPQGRSLGALPSLLSDTIARDIGGTSLQDIFYASRRRLFTLNYRT